MVKRRAPHYKRTAHKPFILLEATNSYKRLVLKITEIHHNGGDIPCARKESDAEWWFNEDKKDEDRAKRLCMDCPALIMCRRHALYNDEVGIWGAMTRSERLSMRSALVARQSSSDGY